MDKQSDISTRYPTRALTLEVSPDAIKDEPVVDNFDLIR